MSTDKRENVTFAERKEEFECQVQTAQTIAISGHMNPDGDCIGSCLGLYTYIVEQYPEKEVTLFLEPVQDKFSFLKYADQITQEKKIDGPYDLFFSLDCSDTDRLHNFKGYFEEAKYKICVDHHFTNEDLVTYALSCRTLLPPAKYCLICLTGIRFPLNARRIFTWVLFMIPVYSSIPIQQEKRWGPQVLYLKKAFIPKISLTGHFTRSPMCRIRFLAVH